MLPKWSTTLFILGKANRQESRWKVRIYAGEKALKKGYVITNRERGGGISFIPQLLSQYPASHSHGKNLIQSHPNDQNIH